MFATTAITLLIAIFGRIFTTPRMRAQTAECGIGCILLCLLLAVPFACSAWLTINVDFRDIQFTSTAFAGLLGYPELDFMLLLLPPFQQAALVIAVLLFYGIQIEVSLDQRKHRLVGLIEPLVQKNRTYQRFQRVTGHTCFVTATDVALDHFHDLYVFRKDVQLMTAHQFAPHARQKSLTLIRVLIEKELPYDRIQNCVAEKLKPFIVR